MQKEWVLKKSQHQKKIIKLADALGIPKYIAAALYKRNVRDFESAKSFFRPHLIPKIDPFLMKNMSKAVEMIASHVKANSKIMIYGDYDVDGTTAVAVFLNYFKRLSDQLFYHVPDRKREGYGVSQYAVDLSIEKGVDLFITLDCGITAHDALLKLKENNIETIVCDHHLPSDKLPEGCVLNPKIEGCNYPYKDLSGCGVGVKLLEACAQKGIGEKGWISEQHDLLAISIGADMVPITNENRYFAAQGLAKMKDTCNPGLMALLQISGNPNIKNMQQISFGIGPRINAAGRMDHASKVVELFTTEDTDAIVAIAEEINQDNIQRKEIESETSAEAWAQITSKPGYEKLHTNIAFGPHWEKGLIGIVASKIINQRHLPTIILTSDGNTITGSARSVGNINIYDCLKSCDDLLLKYGGHAAAAGLTMPIENLEQFEKKFNATVASVSKPNDFNPQIHIDAEIELNEITPKAVRILEQFEPCGIGNPTPIYYAKDLIASGMSVVGKNHLKFLVRHNNKASKKWNAIFFGGIEHAQFMQNKSFALAFEIGVNEWQGKREIQLFVKDIRF